MTTTKGATSKPLNATQMRTATELLRTDYWRLMNQVRERFDEKRKQEHDALIKSFVADPKVVDVIAKVERYKKTVDKRLKAFAEDFKGLGLEVVAPQLNVVNFTYPRAAKEVDEAVRELQRKHDRQWVEVQQKMHGLQASAERKIMLASLGEVDDILALPSVDEILGSVA